VPQFRINHRGRITAENAENAEIFGAGFCVVPRDSGQGKIQAGLTTENTEDTEFLDFGFLGVLGVLGG
jgi:hypothetical protein